MILDAVLGVLAGFLIYVAIFIVVQVVKKKKKNKKDTDQVENSTE